MNALFIENAKEIILKLNEKHQIIFVSNTLEKVRSAKAKRVFNDFKEIKYCLHFTKDKDTVDWDIIIEDNPKTILKLRESNKVIIFDHPYNNSIQEHKNTQRVTNWLEINNLIEELNL